MRRVLIAGSVVLMCGCSPAREILPVPPGINGDCSPELIETANKGNDADVRALVARGAKGHCDESEHQLYRAIDQNDNRLLERWLAVGADPNGFFADYCGPPLAAAYIQLQLHNGDAAMLRSLLEWGADPAARWPPHCAGLYVPFDASVDVPLMIAASAGNMDAVQSLLDAGADYSVKNSHGRTAADYARLSGHPAVAQLLDSFVGR